MENERSKWQSSNPNIEPVGCLFVGWHVLKNMRRIINNIRQGHSYGAYARFGADAFLDEKRPWDHAVCTALGIPLIDRSKKKNEK